MSFLSSRKNQPSVVPGFIPCIITILGGLLFLGVALEVQAAQITLAWDPNAEPDLAGYKIYLGSASSSYYSVIDVGNNTTFTVDNLSQGATYFFSVTAYDTQGNESDFSNEVYKAVVPQYRLTVNKRGSGVGTVSGEGISCGPACEGVYDEGTRITLTVSPEAGSSFTGWSGNDCSGIGECTLTMGSDKNLTAGLVTSNSGISKKNRALKAESDSGAEGTYTLGRRFKGSLGAPAKTGGGTSYYVITRATDRRGTTSNYYSLNSQAAGLRSKFDAR